MRRTFLIGCVVALAASTPALTTGTARAAGPLKGVVQVATGGQHSCAALTNGRARCWGANGSGQVGDGTIQSSGRRTPVTVITAVGGPPLAGIVSIAAGGDHSCAVLTSGEARCWGDNFWGQLGDGTNTERTTPVTVLATPGGGPLTGISSIATGSDHTCALLTSGEARCWGLNQFGQLGDGTITNRSIPVPVRESKNRPLLTGITILTAGGGHTCALLATTQARCWGSGTDGELGDGSRKNKRYPFAVRAAKGGPVLTGIADIATGDDHTCALLAIGEARCWGFNASGQIGDGTTTRRVTPAVVLTSPGGAALTGIVRLGAGGIHNCVIVSGGEARCWGNNSSGQAGDGTNAVTHTTPVPVLIAPGGSPLTGLTGIDGGFLHTCGRLGNGQARCWGNNFWGQLGNGSTVTSFRSPVVVMS